MWQAQVRCARRALFVAVFSLPFSTTATAVEIHYARAIGDSYEYPPLSAPERAARPVSNPDPVLPGLGTEAPPPAAAESGRSWSRILVGALVVGAIAALAKGGGGGEAEVQVDVGGSTPPAAPPAPSPGTPSTGGGSSGGGGTTASPGGSSTPAPSPSLPGSGGSSGSGGGDGDGRGKNDKGKDSDKGKSDKGKRR